MLLNVADLVEVKEWKWQGCGFLDVGGKRKCGSKRERER